MRSENHRLSKPRWRPIYRYHLGFFTTLIHAAMRVASRSTSQDGLFAPPGPGRAIAALGRNLLGICSAHSEIPAAILLNQVIGRLWVEAVSDPDAISLASIAAGYWSVLRQNRSEGMNVSHQSDMTMAPCIEVYRGSSTPESMIYVLSEIAVSHSHPVQDGRESWKAGEPRHVIFRSSLIRQSKMPHPNNRLEQSFANGERRRRSWKKY
jgi:hypothetical protein